MKLLNIIIICGEINLTEENSDVVTSSSLWSKVYFKIIVQDELYAENINFGRE